MDEERFNMSVRKFLKKVGVTSQREIERCVREAVENKRLSGSETLKVSVTLDMEGMSQPMVIDGEIALE